LKGHDFSRAINAAITARALAPEGMTKYIKVVQTSIEIRDQEYGIA
jgi:hypothetical protein